MTDDETKPQEKKGPSAGPLRLDEQEDGSLYVIGFGLWLEVKNREEGLQLIAELEDQGYRLCY